MLNDHPSGLAGINPRQSERHASTTPEIRPFLCHASEDKAVVSRLYRRLTKDGFKPWFDKVDLLPGQVWRDEIPKEVRSSDVVIVCISKRSLSKEGYVQKEIRMALEAADEKPPGTTYIIPALLEVDAEMPSVLDRWQYCDLTTKAGYGKLLDALRSQALKKRAKLNPVEEIDRVENNPSPQRLDLQFEYGAQAISVVGEIFVPERRSIPSQAAAVLSPHGGRASSHIKGLRLTDLPLKGIKQKCSLSFSAAFSELGGSFDEIHEIRTIYAISIIENFKLAGCISADRIVMRLAMHFAHARGDPSFSFAGSKLENLRIGGQPIGVRVGTALTELAGLVSSTPHESPDEKERWMEAPFVSSLVSDIDAPPEIVWSGNAIEIPKIGFAKLTEAVVTQNKISLTMLRIALHDEAGYISVGSGTVGGMIIPPGPSLSR